MPDLNLVINDTPLDMIALAIPQAQADALGIPGGPGQRLTVRSKRKNTGGFLESCDFDASFRIQNAELISRLGKIYCQEPAVWGEFQLGPDEFIPFLDNNSLCAFADIP